MSDSSPPPQPLQEEHTLESDVVPEVPPSLTPNQPDLETAPTADAHNLDPEYNIPEEDEREISTVSSGMPLHIDPPIADPHDSVSDVTLTSPSGDPNTRRGGTKPKKGKGKGKGKGKVNAKMLKAIQEKFQTLLKNLNPIPFIPTRIPDFANHEKLLRKLGLWDFVHIDFDRSIKADLIAELVANYNPKQRGSYVNEHRYKVNRADLARAFKLPLKKEKGSVGGVEVDMDWEELSDDSIGFILDVFSQWLLLHEDTWAMPDEVRDWMRAIRDGHPEKVDWAGLLWLMVEKELKQGGQLTDCYYASHLQHLMKFQRDDLFWDETPLHKEREVDGEAKENGEANEENGETNEEKGEANEEKGEANEENVEVEEAPTVSGPNTELTLGQDGEKEEGMEDVEMVDGENDEEGGHEEQVQWLLKGKNDEVEHFMQPCDAGNDEVFGSFEDRKYEEEEEMNGEEGEEGEKGEAEEEAGNDFHVFHNEHDLEGDGFDGNLLQMGADQVTFGSQDQQLRNRSSMDNARVDLQHMGSAPSFFNNSGKRVMEHDNHISRGDNNKRLRINDSWDNKPMDLGMCMEHIQQMVERARMLYAEKEEGLVQSSMNQQVLLNEVHKRDAVIEHLHKMRMEEGEKKDREIYRLERELYLMGDVLDGYRKALKDVKKAFGEYKERAKLPEEPTYKDTGDGGLMLTGPELERQRKKREEDYKMFCLITEHKAKEVEEVLARQFDGCVEKINCVDQKLVGVETDFKELIEIHVKRKITPPTEEQTMEVSEPEEKVMEASGCQRSPQPEEVPEVSEPLPSPKTEEVPEVSEPLPSPKTEEVPEVSEPLPSPETEEVAEVTESPKLAEAETKPQGIPEAEEKGPEIEEPLQNE